MYRTQHEQDRQYLQGTPGEVWWNGEDYYYLAWLWRAHRMTDGQFGPVLMRMYKISNMPSSPRDVKKGSIHVSSGWRFVCTYLNENFMWTQGRGLNGGRTEKFWQEAFVNGIQRPRGVGSLGRPFNVYDYRRNPLPYNGETQIKYPTNVYGNLAHHNNGYQFNARQGRLYGFRLQTKFSHNTSGSQYSTVCVGQLWRRSSHPYSIPNRGLSRGELGPIIAVKYSRDARTDERHVEEFHEDPYITGNRNSGKEIMIIDILGTGVDNQDTMIFYQTTGIGGRFDGRQAPPDPTTNIQWEHETRLRDRDSLFNNKRVYKSTVRDLWQYFTPNSRPDERPVGVMVADFGSTPPRAMPRRQPLRRQDAVSGDVEDANNNEKPAAIPPLAERLQSVRWDKDWGYGADFIQWNERPRKFTADLTGDSSGSGSSSTGGKDPNHPHQRALVKRKASTPAPAAPRPKIRRQPTGPDYYRMMVVLKPHVRMASSNPSIRPRTDDVLRVINITNHDIPIQLGDIVVTKQSTAPWIDLDISDPMIFKRITVRQEWIPRGEWRYTVRPAGFNDGYDRPSTMAILSNAALAYVRQQQTLRSLRSHDTRTEIPESGEHRRRREREEELDRQRNLYDIHEMFKPKIKF
jgi:hypothetical protein